MPLKRSLFVFNHGERIDDIFDQDGSSWLDRCFDSYGNYIRFDLNMPKSLPKRRNAYEAWKSDPPLTTLGYFHAKIVGEELTERGIKISHVYVSPSLRCIQTANAMIEGLNDPNLKFNIEPGLFQYAKFIQWRNFGHFPIFMTSQEVSNAGYRVNKGYQPIFLIERLSMTESLAEFYARSYEVTQTVLQMTDGNVLFIGHGSILFGTTSQICHIPMLSDEEAPNIFRKIPYLDGKQAQEGTDGTFRRFDSILPSFTSFGNARKLEVPKNSIV